MNDIEPVDLSPTRAELIARVRARGRQIRGRRRVSIAALAALVVVAIAVPAIALGSRSNTSPVAPATSTPRSVDLRFALVTSTSPNTKPSGSCAGVADDTTCYVLGRTLATQADVRDVRVQYDSTAGWTLGITLSSEAAARLAEPVGHRVAIVFANRVLSAPVVQRGITGRTISVAGNLTRNQAIDIATALLGHPPKLPTAGSVPNGDLRIVLVTASQPITTIDAVAACAARYQLECLKLGRTLVDQRDLIDGRVRSDASRRGWHIDLRAAASAIGQLASAGNQPVAVISNGAIAAAPAASELIHGTTIGIPLAGYTRTRADSLAIDILGYIPRGTDRGPALESRIEELPPVIVSGVPVQGRLVVENNTMQPVALPDRNGCRIPWGIGLTKSSVAPDLVFNRACVHGSQTLLPGANYLPFTLIATSSHCGNTTCASGSAMPPLPPGLYKAVLVPTSGVFPPPLAVPIRLVVPLR